VFDVVAAELPALRTDLAGSATVREVTALAQLRHRQLHRAGPRVPAATLRPAGSGVPRCPRWVDDPEHGTWAYDVRVPGPDGELERWRQYVAVRGGGEEVEHGPVAVHLTGEADRTSGHVDVGHLDGDAYQIRVRGHRLTVAQPADAGGLAVVPDRWVGLLGLVPMQNEVAPVGAPGTGAHRSSGSTAR